jgi:hypothetical protein
MASTNSVLLRRARLIVSDLAERVVLGQRPAQNRWVEFTSVDQLTIELGLDEIMPPLLNSARVCTKPGAVQSVQSIKECRILP